MSMDSRAQLQAKLEGERIRRQFEAHQVEELEEQERQRRIQEEMEKKMAERKERWDPEQIQQRRMQVAQMEEEERQRRIQEDQERSPLNEEKKEVWKEFMHNEVNPDDLRKFNEDVMKDVRERKV